MKNVKWRKERSLTTLRSTFVGIVSLLQLLPQLAWAESCNELMQKKNLAYSAEATNDGRIYYFRESHMASWNNGEWTSCAGDIDRTCGGHVYSQDFMHTEDKNGEWWRIIFSFYADKKVDCLPAGNSTYIERTTERSEGMVERVNIPVRVVQVWERRYFAKTPQF